MKTLNHKAAALIASILVLSASVSSCADEPEMPTTAMQADKAGIDSHHSQASGEKDAPCTVWWTLDEGVEYVTVNGKLYNYQDSIVVKVGESVSWEAAIKAGYQFTSPDHNTFMVEAGAEGGIICIPITTQKWNI